MGVHKVLIVRNDVVDLYTRVWCCWELYLAHDYGLTSQIGGLLVVGPNKFRGDVDINDAEASDENDKKTILGSIDEAGQMERVNTTINEIKRIDENTGDLRQEVSQLRAQVEQQQIEVQRLREQVETNYTCALS